MRLLLTCALLLTFALPSVACDGPIRKRLRGHATVFRPPVVAALPAPVFASPVPHVVQAAYCGPNGCPIR